MKRSNTQQKTYSPPPLWEIKSPAKTAIWKDRFTGYWVEELFSCDHLDQGSIAVEKIKRSLLRKC